MVSVKFVGRLKVKFWSDTEKSRNRKRKGPLWIGNGCTFFALSNFFFLISKRNVTLNPHPQWISGLKNRILRKRSSKKWFNSRPQYLGSHFQILESDWFVILDKVNLYILILWCSENRLQNGSARNYDLYQWCRTQYCEQEAHFFHEHQFYFLS